MLKVPPTVLALALGLCFTPILTAARKSAPAPAPASDVVAFWRFERDVAAENRPAAIGPARRLDGAEFFFVEEVPGEFIYDPLQKLSYPNTFSLNFQSEEGHNDALEIPFDAPKAGLAGESVTLEMFLKPEAEWNTPVAMKARLDEKASEMGLEARFFQEFGQTYLHAFFTPPGTETQHFRGGHYGTSAQVHHENLDWRHFAIVCDATAKTLTCYIDYYQVKTILLPGAMDWDSAPLYIGGSPLHSGFKGRIDEVRLTRAALRPEQMLRARHAPLAGVNFTSTETILPRDTGYIDLKEAFGAVGDGKIDDTAALQEAFRVLSNRSPINYHTLYIPPGTYLISDTLQSGRFFTVQGAGADKTILKLRDQCAGFGEGTEPRPVWRASSTMAPPASNEEPNGDSSKISIYDLAIDTGKGNPTAKGLEYHSNDGGRLQNVEIRSGDRGGTVGLDLTQKVNGPALIKNVRVTGFDYGVSAAYQEYSMTFEGLTLEGQKVAGIRNNGHILAIRKLLSTNRVPAILSEGGNSMITLLDSTLKGGAKGTAAIESDGGLYALRVETPDYPEAIRNRLLVDAKSSDWKSEVIRGPKIAEYIGDHIVVGHGLPKGALQLPIEETPEVPWGDIHQDWVNVQSFKHLVEGDDWAAAIQAAIDSGARTVYFPPGSYETSRPVHLRGKIERLFGMGTRLLHVADENNEPSVIFDEPDASRIVSIERLDVDGIQHASKAILVLKSCNPGRYTNTEDCGKLFMEDVSGTAFRFDFPQRVWARQWNPVCHGEGPGILSKGATLWCLGFTTKDASSKLWAEASAQTEILGAFIFPFGEIPPDRPIFKNVDSKMAVIYGTSVARTDYQLHVLDVQGGDIREIGTEQLKKIGTRARMDLYTSDASVPSTTISPAETPDAGSAANRPDGF